MPSHQVRTTYDVMYGATRAHAMDFSHERLTITLDLMLAMWPSDEARWGGIDAVTDLLGRIRPPVWHQKMQ